MDLGATIEDAVVALFREAVVRVPQDVMKALRAAESRETHAIARTQLAAILRNLEEAERLSLPLCQDTGVPVFFVAGRIPPEVEEGIRRGVVRATREVPLRPNAVHPLTRDNPGTNVGEGLPRIVYRPTDEKCTFMTVMPKGAGSENMSALTMLAPSQGMKGIKNFVLDTVVGAGGRPCPPTIVGIGIGGTADQASELAKEALLRPLDETNEDPLLHGLEEEMEEALNRTGIGPMGLGGRTTVLGVRARLAYCHTASLPVAVNLQCWAARRASACIRPDGSWEVLP